MYMDLRKKTLISSILFMGLGHILFLKQQVKGIFFMLIELATLWFIVFDGFTLNFNGPIVRELKKFITLGVFDPSLPVKQRDHSIFLLVEGLFVIIILLAVIAIYAMSIYDAMKGVKHYEASGGEYISNKQFIHGLTDSAFPAIGLSPTFILLGFFVLMPLMFSFLIAFTNYAAPKNVPPANKVDWVGFTNFVDLFGGQTIWASALGRVLLWTLIWGVLSTAAVYFMGMFTAIVLNSNEIKIAPVFRSVFILPYAIPSVISLMVWGNLLNGTFGPINLMLMQAGLIDKGIPWLTDGTVAKVSMIIVNTWAGFPYHMLMVTSIMTSISPDIYEAASIDGATRFQQTRKITMPLVLTQTFPLIIMSFTYNINNFGAAFFLFNDVWPTAADTVTSKASATEIVVTWIYKLTINPPQQYHYASVLAILVFVILTPFAVYNYTKTKAYKEGA